MKNIHIIPAPKPNKLVSDLIESKCSKDTLAVNDIKVTWYILKHQNIHITSNEESKKGDHIIYEGNVYKVAQTDLKFSGDYTMRLFEKDDSEGFVVVNPNLVSKIIITSDKDLIKDGVQAIDDEFLEWLIKNQSCDYVEVVKKAISDHKKRLVFHKYKIILPDEEPKQVGDITEKGIIDTIGNCANCGVEFHIHKQETLEDAAENSINQFLKDVEECGEKDNSLLNIESKSDYFLGFKQGAKYQQEKDKKLYSEDEVKELIWKSRELFTNRSYLGLVARNKKYKFLRWFEQNKKK